MTPEVVLEAIERKEREAGRLITRHWRIETTVTTEHLAEGIAADYDAEERLAGIEILDAVKRFGDREVFRQVVLENVTLASDAR